MRRRTGARIFYAARAVARGESPCASSAPGVALTGWAVAGRGPGAIVAGLDVHPRRITVDLLDTATGLAPQASGFDSRQAFPSNGTIVRSGCRRTPL
jgi:hypothetical protein